MRSTGLILFALLIASNALAVEPWGRACRNDLFTVDVPVAKALSFPWLALPPAQDMAISADPGWFDPPCAYPHTIVEDIYSDLAPLQQRHYRVHFECDDRPGALAVRADAVCHVIGALDQQLQGLIAYDAADIYIARECNGTAQTGNQSAPGTAWQFEAINTPALFTAGQTAQVAVIDTRSVITNHRTVDHAPSTTAFPMPVADSEHASMVIGAIRDLAPTQMVDRYVGLRDPKGGPTSDVAFALKQVILNQIEYPTPLIVNLSLGWPAEMAVRTYYSPDSEHISPPDLTRTDGRPHALNCVESPVGESVRAGLQFLADRPGGDTVSIAAAGNRLLTPVAPDWVVDSAEWDAIGGRFAPAAWADPALKLISVGASRAGGVAGHGYSDNKLPDLFAPGRHVPVPDPNNPGQRISISGTSIAAAYASGAAAYIADQPPGLLPTTLYDSLLSTSRCGVATPSGPMSALEVPGPSFLRLASEPPAICQNAIATMPVPMVCPAGGCPYRQTTLSAYAPSPLEADGFAQGVAFPQPSPRPCSDFDCFSRIDKTTKQLEAWFKFKQIGITTFTRPPALDRAFLLLVKRLPSGKAVVLERHEMHTATFSPIPYTEQKLGGVSLNTLTTELTKKSEVHLETQWRGKHGAWTDRSPLPTHWD